MQHGWPSGRSHVTHAESSRQLLDLHTSPGLLPHLACLGICPRSRQLGRTAAAAVAPGGGRQGSSCHRQRGAPRRPWPMGLAVRHRSRTCPGMSRQSCGRVNPWWCAVGTGPQWVSLTNVSCEWHACACRMICMRTCRVGCCACPPPLRRRFASAEHTCMGGGPVQARR